MKRFTTVLLLVFVSRAACASGEIARYDLRVRLEPGEAHLVRHNGEISGTMVVSGRKIASSMKGNTSYEIRVLESRADASKVRLTFRSDSTIGASGGVTFYAPFSAVIEKPVKKTANGDAIRGQIVDVTVSSSGNVAWNLKEPSSPNRRFALKGKALAERNRITQEWAAYTLKNQTLEKFRSLVGARLTKTVAIGESWRGQFLLNLGYATRRIEVFYMLTQVEKGIALVTTSVIELPEKFEKNALTNMKNVRWKLQTGTLRIDLATGWPLSTQENGQSFSQLQQLEKKSVLPRNLLTSYGKSSSQVITTPLLSSSLPQRAR